MRISDWSSDVCSSDLHKTLPLPSYVEVTALDTGRTILVRVNDRGPMVTDRLIGLSRGAAEQLGIADRSEEHTSELQSLMRISYAVFCLKKTKNHIPKEHGVKPKLYDNQHNSKIPPNSQEYQTDVIHPHH